jgi:hypothetical protein
MIQYATSYGGLDGVFVPLGEARRLAQRILEISHRSGNFQQRVHAWMLDCFGDEISADRLERNHRFLEEALELVQACGATKDDALQLVNYVFGRPVGDPIQEVGGVLVTLATLCQANRIAMMAAAETELARNWDNITKIRAKQASKPHGSPLPQVVGGDNG